MEIEKMINSWYHGVILAFLFFQCICANELDVLNQYKQVCFPEASLPCYLLNGDKGPFGCSQGQQTVVSSTLKIFATVTETINFLKGFPPGGDSGELYFLLAPKDLLANEEGMNLLADGYGGTIASVLLTGNTPSPPTSGYSGATKDPNRRFGTAPSLNYQWNPLGNSINSRLFPYYFYYLEDNVAKWIIGNFTRYYFDDQVEFILESNGLMWSHGKNSTQCLQDYSCYPLGGQSTWSSSGKFLDQGLPLIGISAQMDSEAFMKQFAYGASDSIASVAVLMAVAEAYRDYRTSNTTTRNMIRQAIFMIFTDETFAYSGSGRFFKDIDTFQCQQFPNMSEGGRYCENPYVPSLKFLEFRNATWEGIIDVGQIGSATQNQGSKYSLHKTNKNDALLVTALKRAFGTELTDSTVPLNASGMPPESVQTFLINNLTAVAVTDYNAQFSNKFFNTMFDTVETVVPVQSLCDAASSFTKALIDLTYSDTTGQVSANCSLISLVMDCFAVNFRNCSLATEYLGQALYDTLLGYSPNDPLWYSNYAGQAFPLPIFAYRNPGQATRSILLNTFFGYQNAYNYSDIGCQEDKDCTDVYKLVNNNFEGINSSLELQNVICSRQMCIVTDTYYHDAFGTGLSTKNQYRTDFFVNGELGGTFAESYWAADLGLCGGPENSSTFNAVILATGFLTYICSGLVIYASALYLRKKTTEMPISELST